MKRPYVAILCAVAIAFFATSWWFGAPQGGLYNSPDETANAFWAERLAAGEPLEIRDQAVGLGEGHVHPRSMAVSGDRLVPGSFPGLIVLFGALRLLTHLPLAAMTPLFTAVAGLLLFALLQRIFDRRTAFWSALLFYLHPAVIYYSGRGLFHNMLFIDLMIAALAMLLLTRYRFAGGVLFGLAIVTRASEILWVGPLAAALLIAFERRRLKRWVPAMIGAALPLVLWLWFNAAFYGAPFTTPYVAPAPASAPISATGDQPVVDSNDAPPESAAASILPFGFHPRRMLMEGFDYGLALFWWYSLLSLAGFAILAARWKKRPRTTQAYLITMALAAGWLLAFYGSWYIRDNLDPDAVTIGTSYARYFLPAYVLGLPLAAAALIWLSDRARRTFFIAAAAILFAVLGLRLAVFEGAESLAHVRATLRGNADKQTRLLAAIPPETVIMTARFDKVLFPERIRIIPQTDASAWAALGRLAETFPVAWYGLEPSDDEWEALKNDALRVGLETEAASSPVPGELLVTFKRLP